MTAIGIFIDRQAEMKFENMRLWIFLLIAVFSLTFAYAKTENDSLMIQQGVASFYGKRFHLRKTANGEVFNMDSLTAAHKYLPFNTWVKVTRQDTQDFVWVRINDRLPKTSKRIIDLSRKAASTLNMRDDGITKVTLQVGTIDEMNSLYSHFEGSPPGTIRVRWYEKSIQIAARFIDWCWSLGC